ncbi:MAG: TolC family protein [Planctomycetales bacterium]|nr:TolC family protein [Planctomycetales bacterium]
MSLSPARAFSAILGALLFAAGCAESAIRSAAEAYDAEAAEFSEKVLAPWRESAAAARPSASAPGKPAEPGTPAPQAPEVPAGVREIAPDLSALTLPQTLRIAIRHSREYRSRVESLRLAGSALRVARRPFFPSVNAVLASTLSGSWDDSLVRNETSDSVASSAGLTATQNLPWGGSLSVGLTETLADGIRDESDPRHTTQLSGSVSWTQPLTKGFGFEEAREPWTAAERALVDEVRNFELFRQDFVIRTTRTYYDLLRQKETVANGQKRLDQADFEYRRSRALFEVGELAEIELLRAEQQKFQAEAGLLDARDSYRDALDNFAIELGLPTGLSLGVADARPDVRPVDVDVEAAVRSALAHRLDYAIERDRLEDARRSYRISEKQLLPDFSLTGSYSANTRAVSSWRHHDWNNHTWSLGGTLTLPILDRTSETAALLSARTSLDQSERGYKLFVDQLVIGVRQTVRRLQRTRTSLDIQDRIRKSAEKNLRVAQIRFQAGEVSNREVGDARDSLFDAENEYIRNLVDLEIARIQLLRDMGVLIVGSEGEAKE